MKNPGRIVLVVLVTLMVLFAAGVVAGYVWVNRYLASDDFRRMVSRKTSEALQVDGQFEKFHWSGLAIYSEGFTANGGPASPIDQVLLQQLHANLNLAAAFHGVWEIDQLEVGQFKLTLKEAGPAPAPQPIPPPAAPSSGLIPSTFRIDTIRLDQVDISWPESMAGGGTASHIAVEMKSTAGEPGWDVEGKGGTFAMARFPIEEIKDFSLRLRPDRLYLTKSELHNPSQGVIHVTGEIGLGEEADLDLHFDVAAFPVEPILPPDWRARIFGDLDASFHLTRAGTPAAPWHIDGQAHLNNGHLEAIPALDQLATFTQTQEYRTLKLQTAETDFVLGPDRMEFNNIAVESQGFIRTEGNVVIEGDALSGTINLGLPSSRLTLLPGATTLIFTESRGVYVWTPVHLGGTIQNPTEDLSGRIIGAVIPAVKEGAQKAIDKGVELLNGFLHGATP